MLESGVAPPLLDNVRTGDDIPREMQAPPQISDVTRTEDMARPELEVALRALDKDPQVLDRGWRVTPLASPGNSSATRGLWRVQGEGQPGQQPPFSMVLKVVH